MPVTRDTLILKITREGDANSWEEFVDLYHPYLLAVARRCGIAEHDASDLVQEVFVTLLRVMPQFEYRSDRGRFRAWLKTIMRNSATDHLRARMRSREVTLREEFPMEKVLHAEIDDDDADQSQILKSAMQDVQESSQPATWHCFEEHFLKKRTAADVSQEIGVSSHAVYMNSSRTYARIWARCAEIDADLARPPRTSPQRMDHRSVI